MLNQLLFTLRSHRFNYSFENVIRLISFDNKNFPIVLI